MNQAEISRTPTEKLIEYAMIHDAMADALEDPMCDAFVVLEAALKHGRLDYAGHAEEALSVLAYEGNSKAIATGVRKAGHLHKDEIIAGFRQRASFCRAEIIRRMSPDWLGKDLTGRVTKFVV